MGNSFFSDSGGYALLVVSFLAATLTLIGSFKKEEGKLGHKRLIGLIGISLAAISLCLSCIIKYNDDKQKKSLEKQLADSQLQSQQTASNVQILVQNLKIAADTIESMKDKQIVLKNVLDTNLKDLGKLTNKNKKELKTKMIQAVALANSLVLEDGAIKKRITTVDTGLTSIHTDLVNYNSKLKDYAEGTKQYVTDVLTGLKNDLVAKYDAFNKEIQYDRHHTDSIIDSSYIDNLRALKYHITSLEKIQRADSITADSLRKAVVLLLEKPVTLQSNSTAQNQPDIVSQNRLKN